MKMQQWWSGLEPRERRTLLVGGIALAIILYVFVIWLPAHRDTERLEARLADQRSLLAWMQQTGAEARALRAAGGGSGQVVGTGNQALFSFVDQSAREAGLAGALRQVEPSGEQRVRVTLQQADFDMLASWLVVLKTRHGVDVTAASIRRTETAGLVDAQLVVETPTP